MFKLIVGLGNPGTKYGETYHNIGAIFIDSLAENKWKRITRKHFIYSQYNDSILLKTALFMNESGIAVCEALSYFKILPSSILVVHDDSDFYWGSYKLTFGQGSAGHKGIESIVSILGTNKFWRLRIGIRNSGEAEKRDQHKDSRKKAGDFVLNKITDIHRDKLDYLFSGMKKRMLEIK